jgi:hypothetical protein
MFNGGVNLAVAWPRPHCGSPAKAKFAAASRRMVKNFHQGHETATEMPSLPIFAAQIDPLPLM